MLLTTKMAVRELRGTEGWQFKTLDGHTVCISVHC